MHTRGINGFSLWLYDMPNARRHVAPLAPSSPMRADSSAAPKDSTSVPQRFAADASAQAPQIGVMEGFRSAHQGPER